MNKVIVIPNAGTGIDPAIFAAFEKAGVAVITSAEAMEKFGKSLANIDPTIFDDTQITLDVNFSMEEAKIEIPRTKQKHPPLSFRNRGKGGKRKQW